MDTTRNRARILAGFLRATVKHVRMSAQPVGDITGAREVFDEALSAIEAVAEELEQVAAVGHTRACVTFEITNAGRKALASTATLLAPDPDAVPVGGARG